MTRAKWKIAYKTYQTILKCSNSLNWKAYQKLLNNPPVQNLSFLETYNTDVCNLHEVDTITILQLHQQLVSEFSCTSKHQQPLDLIWKHQWKKSTCSQEPSLQTDVRTDSFLVAINAYTIIIHEFHGDTSLKQNFSATVNVTRCMQRGKNHLLRAPACSMPLPHVQWDRQHLYTALLSQLNHLHICWYSLNLATVFDICEGTKWSSKHTSKFYVIFLMIICV